MFLLVVVSSALSDVCANSEGSSSIDSVEWHGLKYTLVENAFWVSQGTECPTGLLEIQSKVSIDEYVNCENIQVIGVGSLYNAGGFVGCEEISEVVIHESVTSLGTSAFESCSGLENVTLVSSMESIGSLCFYKCVKLLSIELPSTLKTLGGTSFMECIVLESVVIPEGITAIAGSTFSGCEKLTDVKLPSSLSILEQWAFTGCVSLKKIVLPSGLTMIYYGAFEDCAFDFVGFCGTHDFSPDGIYFNNGVKVHVLSDYVSESFGIYDLSEESLSDEECNRPEIETVGDNVCKSSSGYPMMGAVWTNGNGLQYVVSSDASSFSAKAENTNACQSEMTIDDIVSTDWGGCSNIAVTAIADSGFNGCSNSASITLPSSITSIGFMSFGSCSNLTSINLPSSLTSIGLDAFSGCYGLTSITVPSSIRSIESGTFSGCSSLTSITLPSSLTSIGSGAFRDCSELSSITLPATLRSIVSSAFYGCTRLAIVGYCGTCDFTDGINHFESAESLQGVDVSDDYIGDTFGTLDVSSRGLDCSDYPGIKPDSHESVCVNSNGYLLHDLEWDDEFNYRLSSSGDSFSIISCPSATANMAIPESINEVEWGNCNNVPVTSIADNAFEGSDNLESIVIGNLVTHVGSYAFKECSVLESVRLSNSLISIGCGVFDGCSKLKSITLPASFKTFADECWDNFGSTFEFVGFCGNEFSDDVSVCGGNWEVGTIYVPLDYNGETLCGHSVDKGSDVLDCSIFDMYETETPSFADTTVAETETISGSAEVSPTSETSPTDEPETLSFIDTTVAETETISGSADVSPTSETSRTDEPETLSFIDTTVAETETISGSAEVSLTSEVSKTEEASQSLPLDTEPGNEENSSGQNVVVIIGIVAGVIVVALISILLVILVVRLNKKNEEGEDSLDDNEAVSQITNLTSGEDSSVVSSFEIPFADHSFDDSDDSNIHFEEIGFR